MSDPENPTTDAVDRRIFLKGSAALLGAAGLAAGAPSTSGAVEPPETPPWMKSPGAGMSEYGSPSKFESKEVKNVYA